MTNERIANRIAEVVAAFERGDVGATAVAESVELHEPALEGISREVRDRLHQLSVEVVKQDLSPLELEMLGLEPTREAVTALKLLLGGIS